MAKRSDHIGTSGMSARTMLRLLLAVQALAVLAIAALVLRAVDPASASAALVAAGLLAGAAAVLLVRALIFTNNFVLSARAASATPAPFRLTARGWLCLWGEEFAASMLQSSWYTPRGAPRQHIYPDAPPLPVLLLHGYGCNSGYWHHLCRRLARQRINHACIDLAPVMGDIDGYGAQVEAAAARLCAAAGADRFIIVAHSMGGLVARAWLRQRGAGPASPSAPALARLITLGSPHQGTVLANLGPGVNAAQMRRARSGAPSAWLAALAQSETGASGEPLREHITSIYSHHDNIVAPQTSSELAGARNIAVGGVGHVALGRNRRVLDCVMALIEAEPGAQAQAPLPAGQPADASGKLAP